MRVAFAHGYLHGVVFHVVTGSAERERVVPGVTGLPDVLLREELPVGQAADVCLLSTEIRDLERNVPDDFLLDREVPLLCREVLELARGGYIEHAAGIAQSAREVVEGDPIDEDGRIAVPREGD